MALLLRSRFEVADNRAPSEVTAEEDYRADAAERLHRFGFGVAGSGNNQQPERVTIKPLDRGRGQHGVKRADVIVLAKPFLEHLVGLLQASRLAGETGGR